MLSNTVITGSTGENRKFYFSIIYYMPFIQTVILVLVLIFSEYSSNEYSIPAIVLRSSTQEYSSQDELGLI